MIQEIFAVIGIASTSFTVFAVAVKLTASHLLSRELERYRSTLETSRIQYENALRESSFVNQTKFSLLHTERAQKTAELWRALRNAGGACERFVHPAQMGGDEKQDKRGEEAGDEIFKLNQLIYKNSIYFPKDLADRLVEYGKKLDQLFFGAYWDYRKAREEFRNPYWSDDPSKRTEFGEAWDKLVKEIKPLLIDLEAECRKLLGVE